MFTLRPLGGSRIHVEEHLRLLRTLYRYEEACESTAYSVFHIMLYLSLLNMKLAIGGGNSPDK